MKFQIPFPQTDLTPEYSEYASSTRDALMREISKQKQDAVTRANMLGLSGSGVSEYPQLQINEQMTNALKSLYGDIAQQQAGTKIQQSNIQQQQDWQKAMSDIQQSQVLERMAKQFEQQKELMNMQKKISQDMQKDAFGQNLLGMGLGAIATPFLGIGSSAIHAGLGSLLGLAPNEGQFGNLATLMGLDKGTDKYTAMQEFYPTGFKGLMAQQYGTAPSSPNPFLVHQMQGMGGFDPMQIIFLKILQERGWGTNQDNLITGGTE